MLSASPHHQAEGADEGIRTAADILYIIHNYVQAGDHLRGRLTSSTVKRKYGKSCHRILAVLDTATSINVSAYTMLRGEELLQINLRGVIQYVDRGTQVTVNTTWISDQADPFPDQTFESPGFQNLDPDFDHRRVKDSNRGRGVPGGSGTTCQQQGG